MRFWPSYRIEASEASKIVKSIIETPEELNLVEETRFMPSSKICVYVISLGCFFSSCEDSSELFIDTEGDIFWEVFGVVAPKDIVKELVHTKHMEFGSTTRLCTLR